MEKVIAGMINGVIIRYFLFMLWVCENVGIMELSVNWVIGGNGSNTR